MKAAVCDVFGKPLTIREVPTPSAGPGELLIRVHGCGVCHSDLHLVDGDWAEWGTPLPIIPGHEVTGIVEKIGEGTTAFAPGDRAGVPWMPRLPVKCRNVPTINATPPTTPNPLKLAIPRFSTNP